MSVVDFFLAPFTLRMGYAVPIYQSSPSSVVIILERNRNVVIYPKNPKIRLFIDFRVIVYFYLKTNSGFRFRIKNMYKHQILYIICIRCIMEQNEWVRGTNFTVMPYKDHPIQHVVFQLSHVNFLE